MIVFLRTSQPAERASHDTRHGAEGEESHGCFVNTRVQLLEALEDWAEDPLAPKVYCLNGLLRTGKTSIVHSLSDRLDKKPMLGTSFFCSHSALKDALRIIPTIVSMLSLSNPNI